MATSVDETLTSVWRQVLAEGANTVTLENRSFPVRQTSRSRLREVDFEFEGHALRGLEQNPETASRWAQMAREGKKVMQFLQQRRYIAVVVDGAVQFERLGLGKKGSPETVEQLAQHWREKETCQTCLFHHGNNQGLSEELDCSGLGFSVVG